MNHSGDESVEADFGGSSDKELGRVLCMWTRRWPRRPRCLEVCKFREIYRESSEWGSGGLLKEGVPCEAVELCEGSGPAEGPASARRGAPPRKADGSRPKQ